MEGIKIWTVLFLCIAIQGLFLSFLLVSRKNRENSKNRKTNFFLSAFIAVFSIIMIFWVGHWNDIFDEFSILTFIYRPIPLMLGPLLYFYIKSLFSKVDWRDLIHCIPFVIVLLYFMPAYFQTNSTQNIYDVLWEWNLLGTSINAFNTISIIFYSIYLYVFFKNKSQALVSEIRNEALKVIKLSKIIIIFFGLFSLVALLNLLIRLTQSDHPIIFDYGMAILISFFIYAIGYLGFNSPRLTLALDNFSPSYSTSRLNAEDAEKLLSTLISHLEKHKPYLNEDYKIGQLSVETNISSHHISELLNKYYNKNFSSVINNYRIVEAKKLLSSDDYRLKKISSVGFDVGFSSPSAFYSWFKKITGTSPANYQKENSRN